jgi:arginine decarboxylase
VTDASELYEVERWGKGYFSVGPNGHVRVHANRTPERSIDLKELVDHLQLRGIGLPILIRFRDILRQRLADIHGAFQTAITQNQYEGRYFCVYPIKVNQQRQVVEEVLDFGRPYDFGLEAGSKPELLAVVAMATNDTPIICNGFKDAEYIEMAMLAQKMGRRITPVVEKYTELRLILEYAQKVGVRPNIGMRVKLAARGGGRWQSSGGYRSKFGLTVAGPAGLLQAPALPSRQPDSEHPDREGRAQRGRTHLCRARQGGRGPRVPRRRRRAGRRLRWLADELRVQRQLHARRVRQRRRLSHPVSLR